MRFLSIAVNAAIIGVSLVSSGIALVDPADAPDAESARSVVAPSDIHRTLRIQEDRDRDAAVGFLILLNMYGGRLGR